MDASSHLETRVVFHHSQFGYVAFMFETDRLNETAAYDSLLEGDKSKKLSSHY